MAQSVVRLLNWSLRIGSLHALIFPGEIARVLGAIGGIHPSGKLKIKT
jgi:hypothetical protein